MCGFCWLVGRREQRWLVGGTNQGRPRCDWHDGRGVSWKKQSLGWVERVGVVWGWVERVGMACRWDRMGWDSRGQARRMAVGRHPACWEDEDGH
jgi:hypothetical protein